MEDEVKNAVKKSVIYFVSNEVQLLQINKNIFFDTDNYVVMLDKSIINKGYEVVSNAKILSYTNCIDEHNVWIDALKIANKYFFDLNHVRVGDKYLFKEILGYNNNSILEIDSLNYFSGHTERLAKVFFKVLTINTILDRIKPGKVVLMGPTSDWENIILTITTNRSIEICDRRSLKDKILSSYFEHSFEISVSIGKKRKKILLPLPLLSVGVLMKNIKGILPPLCPLSKRRLESKLKNVDILLYCINSKYIDVVVPLMKSISQDLEFNSMLLVPRSFDNILKLQNEFLNFQFVENYRSLKTYKNALSIYIRIIIRSLKLRFSKTINARIFDYNDIDLSFILSKEIKKSFYLSFSYILNVLLMKSVIAEHNSKILFMPHFSEPTVKAFVVGAREMQIPTICMHRGAVGLSSEYGTFDGDKILVPGFYSKGIFEKWGVPSEKIIPTGTPIFDELIKSLDNSDLIQKQVREILKIDPDVAIITYLTQSSGGHFDENNRKEELKYIFSALKEIDNVFLAIKLHPTEENTNVYCSIAEEMGLMNYIVIKNEIKLDDLLIASKVALTKNSTTGFNALLAGCRLVILGFDQNTLMDNPFVDPKISDVVKDSEDLVRSVKTVLEDESNVQSGNREHILEFIAYHFNSLDLQATQRIKDVIYDSLRSRDIDKLQTAKALSQLVDHYTNEIPH